MLHDLRARRQISTRRRGPEQHRTNQKRQRPFHVSTRPPPSLTVLCSIILPQAGELAPLGTAGLIGTNVTAPELRRLPERGKPLGSLGRICRRADA
jgi:hypothetical protein